MVKWKDNISKKDYEKEQLNPASIGGSTSSVHTRLKALLGDVLEVDNLTDKIHSVLVKENLNEIQKIKSGNNCYKRINKAMTELLGTRKEKKPRPFSNTIALSFGGMLHDILLEGNLKEYKIVGDDHLSVGSYDLILRDKCLTRALSEQLSLLKEKFDGRLYNELHIRIGDKNVFVEQGFIKKYPKSTYTLSKSLNHIYEEQSSVRMKCDLMFIIEDNLYIYDFKTTKDYPTFASSLSKYRCQLIFYFLCLLDQKEFLREHGIKNVYGGFIIFDKLVKELSIGGEFIIYENILNIPRINDVFYMFGNYLETKVDIEDIIKEVDDGQED